MAKISDTELVALIEDAIADYVSARTINLDNVGHSMAESIARALHDADTIVIREERQRNGHAADVIAAIARMRAAVA